MKHFSETSLKWNAADAADGSSHTLANELNTRVEELMKTDARVMDIEIRLHQILMEVQDAPRRISYITTCRNYGLELEPLQV